MTLALPGPVESLHRRKIPRSSVTSVAIFLGTLILLASGGGLFSPVLAVQVSQLVFALPNTLAQIDELFERSDNRTELLVGSGEAPSLSTLVA